MPFPNKKTQFSSTNQPKSNGRPKKLVGVINDELKAEGYTPLTKGQVLDAYLQILQLPIERIKELADSKKTTNHPFFYKLIAKELSNGRGSDMLERMLDRSLGKSTQSLDVTSDGDKLSSSLLIVHEPPTED